MRKLVQEEEGYFYVLQIEIDLLCSGVSRGSVALKAACAPDNKCKNKTAALEPTLHEVVLVDGPVNPEAITRIWIADRAELQGRQGAFTVVHPPIGAFGS